MRGIQRIGTALVKHKSLENRLIHRMNFIRDVEIHDVDINESDSYDCYILFKYDITIEDQTCIATTDTLEKIIRIAESMDDIHYYSIYIRKGTRMVLRRPRLYYTLRHIIKGKRNDGIKSYSPFYCATLLDNEWYYTTNN